MNDFQRRAAVTLAALAAYLLGRDIPIMGVDLERLGFDAMRGGPLGGFPHVISLFALGIVPFWSSRLLVEFACSVVPRLARWRQAQPRNQRQLADFARGLGLVFALFQAYGIALGLERLSGVVVEPGWAFRLETTASLAAGTLVVYWLSDVITARGLGDGFVIMLAAPIVADLGQWALAVPELLRVGAFDAGALWSAAALAGGAIALLAVASAPSPRRPPGDPLAGMAALDLWPMMLAVRIASGVNHLIPQGAQALSAARHGLYVALFLAPLFLLTFLRAPTASQKPPGPLSPRWTTAYAQAAIFLVLLLWRINATYSFSLGLENLTFVTVACASALWSARESREAGRL